MYVDSRNGVYNLWSQSLDGRLPKQITNFASGLIFDFTRSYDGKALILARGTVNSDVILTMSNSKDTALHFLVTWKDADPDIPNLKQAKAEYAKLQ